ncbi:MAG: hypothetical protein NVS2B7_24790 [Herpetosiphon sp.]
MSRKMQPFDPARMIKPPSADIAYLLDTATDEVAEVAREHGLPLHYLPTAAIAPDPGQPRRLPAPHDLVKMADAGDQAASDMVARLHELGSSMRQHGQLQPVIVYEDVDVTDRRVTHRLLNGQRRWSAALLAGLPTVWAVVVPRPDAVSRLMRQFEENERRADFTDMERAWALASLQNVLVEQAEGEIPWTVIESQMAVSETRRKELMRLMRFDLQGQALIQRHGWGTWTLRPLMQAVTSGTIPAANATDILRILASATSVTQEVVQALVTADVRGDVGRQPSLRPSAAHNAKPIMHRRMERLQRSIEQLRAQLLGVRDPEQRKAWRAEADVLRRSLDALMRELQD